MYVYVYVVMCMCMCNLYVCVYVCIHACVCGYVYVYVCNSGLPIARFEERHGSVVKSRAQNLVIGALCIE